MRRLDLLALLCLGLHISCSPAEPAARDLEDSAWNRPTVVAVQGVGIQAQASINRQAVFFGDVRVGTESAPTALILSNTGTAPLILQSLPVQGPFAVALPTGDALPITIAPGGSFVFDVSFKPTAFGSATGSVGVVTDLPDPLTVSLAGVGTGAHVQWIPSSIDFGTQRVGTASSPRVAIISNPGSGELEITQLVFSGSAFALTSPPPTPDQPLKIGPGQQAVLSLIFTPTALGQVTGKLSMVSNAVEAAPQLALAGTGVDGQISLTPSLVSFGSVDVGGSSSQSVVLKNTGGYPLKITHVTPPSAAFTLSGLPEELVLQPAESWEFTVAFAPTQRGAFSSIAVIESDAVSNSNFALSMAGTGVAPVVDLQPRSLDFGSASLGTTVTRELVVLNVGEKDLSVSNIAFADAAAGPVDASLDFSLDNGVALPLVVAPTQSARVRVTFTPHAAGTRAARALFFTNAGTVEASLHGVGTSAGLELSVSQLDFGSVLVGKLSAVRFLTLTNTGTEPLILSGLSLGGTDVVAFTLAAPSLPASLQPGASMDVGVTFLPNAERAFSALLRVDSNDPTTPSVGVPLSGTGMTQPLIHLSESSLEFGKQLVHTPSSPRKVRIINGGSSPATLSALMLEDAGASQFSLASQALPLVLQGGQEKELEVTFTPQVEGDASATLMAVFSDPALQLEVALHGQGVRAVLAVSPTVVDFGQIEVGISSEPREIIVTNPSSQELRVTARLKDESEAFSLNASALDNPLPPGGSATLTVNFLSLKEGEALNEVQLFAQGETDPAGRVFLKGLGVKLEEGCSGSVTGTGGSSLLALLALAALGARQRRAARG